MAILLSLTGESGLIFALIPWMPWQVVHVGESLLPLAASSPWMLSVNSLVISAWHVPQVCGIFDRKIVDFGSMRDLRL
jgi:hypothetical protein